MPPVATDNGVCATAGVEERFDDWGIDLLLTGAQKALGAPPGVAILVASKTAAVLFLVPMTLAGTVPWAVPFSGALVIALIEDETPRTTARIIAIADQGGYDGLTFHRVVPDFVVQGGDYRGDGNGGVSWRGEPLRHELGPRKFVRGALGMPRNDDLDSGGSQIFITHRATPHLDGRYTLFGQVRQANHSVQA